MVVSNLTRLSWFGHQVLDGFGILGLIALDESAYRSFACFRPFDFTPEPHARWKGSRLLRSRVRMNPSVPSRTGGGLLMALFRAGKTWRQKYRDAVADSCGPTYLLHPFATFCTATSLILFTMAERKTIRKPQVVSSIPIAGSIHSMPKVRFPMMPALDTAPAANIVANSTGLFAIQ